MWERRRRNFSLVACYSLNFTRCSFLVVKSLVIRCKILSLLAAEVARWKESLVTRCKIHSLLVTKFARYSLQKSLVAKIACYLLQKLLVPKNTRYSLQNWLITRCKIRSLLVAEAIKELEPILIKFSYGRQNLNEFESIEWFI